MARNSGFAAACNAGIRRGSSEYVLVLNQDARIQPDYLSRLLARFEADPALAAAGGKLLHQESPESSPSGFVDTCGIAMRRGRRPVDLRQGDRDDGGPGEWHEVFGVCAAAALYRRSALIDVSEDGQVFPELFVMHKEDVDLAWRLRSAGFRAGVDTAAIGYHARGVRRAADVPGSGISLWFTRARRLLEQERHKPARVRAITWRNQVLLLVLNERQEDFIRSSLDLLVYQALQTGISFMFSPVTTLVSRVEIFGMLPQAFALRRRRRTLTGASLREWLP
jgi:GT2 family glycosyltransferase